MMTRKEAYQALVDLITKGFLTMGVEMAGKPLVFKTVNEKEYQLIKLYAGLPDSPGYGAEFNLLFLVFSLLMFDGYYVLGNREEKLKEYRSFFAGLPDRVCSKVLRELNTIRATSFEAVKFIEGYCYTSDSRSTWKTLGGNSPNRDEFTGVPGTGRLGLNVHQESWMYLNRMLDDEEAYNTQFSMAIMVASASNPKGARTIRSKHDSNMQLTEDRRIKLSLEGHIDAKQTWRPDGWAASVDTAEELLAELDREMTGVKDKHDLFMEQHIKNMRDAAEKRVKEAAARIEKFRELNADVPEIEGSQRPLTPAEVEKFIKSQKKSGIARLPGEDLSPDEAREKFINKIGSKILTARK